MSDFGNQVARHVERYKKRLRVVARESVQDVVDIMQTPIAKGGRLPVDTGFLRNSIGADVGQMPSGPTKPGDGPQIGQAVSVALLRWQPHEVLYVGYSAVYARPMEYKYGFMRGATEQWDTIVAAAAARASAGI